MTEQHRRDKGTLLLALLSGFQYTVLFQHF